MFAKLTREEYEHHLVSQVSNSPVKPGRRWTPDRGRSAVPCGKNREPTSAVAVNEPALGSSADAEGEEGVDRGFERTGTPLHLGE